MSNPHLYKILKKIKSKKIIIGIIGLGYVGLPLAKAFSKKKIRVYGFDTDKKKISDLKNNKSYINYFKNNDIRLMKKNNFKCFCSFDKIVDVDFIIICLPTPLKKINTPEMKYIKQCIKVIRPFLKVGQTISLESTTYPGTTRELIAPELNKFKIGEDFFLVYSPEREDPGNKKYSVTKIPKVLGGHSINCTLVGSKLYELLDIKIIKVSSLEVAEFTKLLENIYRSINIGMINELKNLTLKMNLNIFEIIRAANTKPFGFQAFYPGPGYGGHCIPIDPFYLSWIAKRYKFNTKFIKLSGKINNEMPFKIVKVLKNNLKKNKLNKIIILGVAYKKNVDDIRESPALKIIQLLKINKIKFDYIDPYINKIKSRNIKTIYKSKSLSYENLKLYDACLIITDHDNFDYSKILKYSKRIFDARGRYAFNRSKKIIQV
jgi:UDP-N-acetyl-D-glucosamine dehydrogenase